MIDFVCIFHKITSLTLNLVRMKKWKEKIIFIISLIIALLISTGYLINKNKKTITLKYKKRE